MLERHLSSSERHVNDILKRNTVINKLKLRTFVSNRKKTFKEQQLIIRQQKILFKKQLWKNTIYNRR
jgi:hypothetical protein